MGTVAEWTEYVREAEREYIEVDRRTGSYITDREFHNLVKRLRLRLECRIVAYNAFMEWRSRQKEN